MSWQRHLQAGLPPALPPRPRGSEIARLDLNEGAFPPGPDELAALRDALAGIELNRYPDSGATALRMAMAKRWQIDPGQILVGNGSIEIVTILMTAFRRPGAKLLLPVPTFDQFAALASLHGYQVVAVPLDDNFQIDEQRTLSAIELHRPALAFFASPNNPTGNSFPAALLERLARRMDAAFVVDEAYADFAAQSLLPSAAAVPGLFVMRSLSKIGWAGLRLGALIGDSRGIAAIDRARLPFNVSAPAQALGCAALSLPGRIEARVSAIVRLRQLLAGELARLPGLQVYPSEANFLLVRAPASRSGLCRGLLASGVAVRDVSALPGLAGCLRITVGTAEENRRCVQALAALLGTNRAASPLEARPPGDRDLGALAPAGGDLVLVDEAAAARQTQTQ